MSQGSTPSYAFNNPGSASNILANIIKAQYQNYLGMYVPEENKLISYATDPNTISNAQKRAIGLTQDSFTAQNAGLAKGLETSGVQLTPDQKAAMARQTATTQGLALVDNANRAGSRAYDEVTSVLSGAPSATNIVPSGSGGGATPTGLG